MTMSRKKGQIKFFATSSSFCMWAIFEAISIVVCLFISTKADNRLPRDPKENCLRGRQKLSTSSCKDLFEEENKFPARELICLLMSCSNMNHRHSEGACCKHIRRSNRTFGKKFGTRKRWIQKASIRMWWNEERLACHTEKKSWRKSKYA